MAGSNPKSIIALSVAALIGAGVVFAIFNQIFWTPYTELRRELAKAEEELGKKDNELRVFEAKKKKLQRARLTSFPMDTRVWPTEYDSYLRYLTQDFSEKTIAAPSLTSEPKGQAGKKAGQVIRTWNIRGKAKWYTLVTMLEKFQHTPLLHRIKSIHMERPTGTSQAEKKFVDELAVNITIETLSMLRGDKRPENLWGIDPRVLAVDALAGLGLGMPGWSMLWNSRVLMLPDTPMDRHYDLLQHRNPFRGGLTKEEFDDEYEDAFLKKDQDEEPLPDPPEGEDIRHYVRLVKIYESTQDIEVVVKRGVAPLKFPFITYDPGVPITLSPDKVRNIDLNVNLLTTKGDHRADVIDSISPAGKGVTAELVKDAKGRDGNLKITVRKEAVLGTYVIRLKVRRAVLYNQLTEQYTTLSSRFSYDSFLVKSENGRKDWARGKVIYIDHQDIYFLSKEVTSRGKEGVYRMHTGEFLSDAMQQQLTTAELQELDWWARSPLATSTVGLLGSPGPGPLLAGFALFPGRPGLRHADSPVPVVFGEKMDRIGE